MQVDGFLILLQEIRFTYVATPVTSSTVTPAPIPAITQVILAAPH